MSQKKVKKVEEHENDESDQSMEDVYSGNEKLQVDFEGRNPIDADFHGIKQLLSQLFLNARVNTNELTDMIISQNYVGSVIWQSPVDEEEEEDDEMDDESLIFGVSTVLNLTEKKDKECMKQIREYLIEKSDKKDSLRNILDDPEEHVGFLINERFINIPPAISIPLLESLQKEMTRSVGKKMPFNFKYLLMILKYYKTSSKKKSQKSVEVNFSNPEEEVIAKEAILSFDYSVTEADTGLTGNWLEDDVALTPYRKVIVFEAAKLPTIVDAIRDFVE
ncbi:Protein BCCIP homolog [Sergentomyia squamirostris]